MLIYHLALESDWERARRDGEYTTSTLGRTLAEEGFIHASRPDQLQQTNDRFYRKVRQPLVRLDIDTDRLASPWREEPVGEDTFPHIYGPLNLDAVTAVHPWHRSGRRRSFLEVYLAEVVFRICLLVLAMLLAFLGAFVAQGLGDTGRLVGAVVGLILGAVLAWHLMRRRGRSPYDA